MRHTPSIDILKIKHITPKAMIISIIFGLLIVGYTKGFGADWMFYSKSEFGSYCYDMENMSRLSDHLVRVQQKLILNEKGTMNIVKELGKEYEKASEIITLREIDCIHKKSRILECTFLSEEGKLIKREFYNPMVWDSIIPDSVDDVLCHAIYH